MAIVFGKLVDDMSGATCAIEFNGDPKAYEADINNKIALLVYIAIAALVLTFVYTVCWNLMSQRLATRLRERYFQSLLRLEQSFFDERHAGEVSSRLNSDVQAAQSGTGEKVGMFIASLSFFVSAYVVSFIQQARLAGILVSLVPAFVGVAYVCGIFFQKYAASSGDAVSSGSALASEALSHIVVVEAFGAGPRLEKKFATDMRVAREEGIKKGGVAAFQAGMLYFIAYSANALAFWEGSKMIANLLEGKGSASSVGEVYSVVFILIDACVILGAAAPLLPIFGGAAAAYCRLDADMSYKSLIDGTSDQGQILSPETPGQIEFKDVTFAYKSRQDDPALKGINLVFPAGKHTALVGHSGSGKSTVAGLISRLHDPTTGTVYFDGLPMTEVNVRNLRGFMSLVQQEPSLLDRSILENVALGLINSPIPAHAHLKELLHGSALQDVAAAGKDIDAAARSMDPRVAELIALVRHAAELADAASFIDRLDHGYSTNVGTSGKSLSGGQRQRIALARALIRDPKILILDEATASLDSASEVRIQAAIDRVAKSRTVISIAHRLSTIKDADNIVVFKAGEIIEQGTYAELMALDGSFAAMAKLQVLESNDKSETASQADESDEADSSLEKVRSGLSRKSTKNDQTIGGAGEKDTTDDVHPIGPAVADELEAKRPAWAVIKEIGWFVRPNTKWIIIALFAATIVGVTFSAQGLIFGHTVAALSGCNETPDRIRYYGRFFGGLNFMLACVELLANFFSWASFGLVAERLLYTVRVLSFRSLFEQSTEWHRSASRSPSSLLSIITKDTAALGGFSGSIIGTIFSICVNLLAAIIMSHIIGWRIALVCLTMVPILLGSGILHLRQLSRFEERNTVAFAKSVGITVEAVNNMKTIATLSLEDEVFGTYRRILKSTRHSMLKSSIMNNVWLAISNNTGFFVYCFAYWWGSHLIVRGQATQQQFFTILVAMLLSAQLWGQMFALAPEVSRAKSSASRILQLIHAGSTDPKDAARSADPAFADEETTVSGNGEKAPAQAGGVTVSFEKVDFAYPSNPSVPVLNNVSLTATPGQFVGLVGPSGAGKSTILHLVQRMYRPVSGRVTIDGVDIATTSFRNDIAVVPQDNALFNGTIRFNVSLGARPGREASDEEIIEACKLANIHETIMGLPKGYDTECGPNGSHLSGGQRQRLTIARALVRKPRLLLLDESTSALDAESETALQEGLERAVHGSGITVIAITHRIRTVLRADVIFVVEGGTIVNQGTHESLLRTSETYRKNAQSQMLQ
jgi:ABC-type multidrug transport system fused ATPase/permease subunit